MQYPTAVSIFTTDVPRKYITQRNSRYVQKVLLLLGNPLQGSGSQWTRSPFTLGVPASQTQAATPKHTRRDSETPSRRDSETPSRRDSETPSSQRDSETPSFRRDPTPPSLDGRVIGFCEHPIIRGVIAKAWFTDKTRYGVDNPDAFNPIPVTTLALLMAMVHAPLPLCPENSSPAPHRFSFVSRSDKPGPTSMQNSMNWTSGIVTKTTSRRRRSGTRLCQRSRRISGERFTKICGVCRCPLIPRHPLTCPTHRKLATRNDAPTIKTTNLTTEDRARLKAMLETRTGDTDVESDVDGVSDDDPNE